MAHSGNFRVSFLIIGYRWQPFYTAMQPHRKPVLLIPGQGLSLA